MHTTLPVTRLAQNCRILSVADKAVIVDPGGDAAKIAAELEFFAFKPQAILLTHAHVDHCGAVAELVQRYPKLKVLGPQHDDAIALEMAQLQGECFQVPFSGSFTPQWLNDGQILHLLPDHPIEVLHTPGHSKGSVCYYIRNAGLMLVGDLLVQGGIWERKQPGFDRKALMASLARLKTYPDDTQLLFGHGPNSFLGKEKQDNPYLAQA